MVEGSAAIAVEAQVSTAVVEPVDPSSADAAGAWVLAVAVEPDEPGVDPESAGVATTSRDEKADRALRSR